MFALLHPEMPAATPSDLPVGQGLDASYAWMLIRSVMEELTPEQRALVEELDAGEPIGHVDADGTITEFGLASDETATQGLHGFAPAQPTAVWRRYLRPAQTVMADWRRHRPDLTPSRSSSIAGPKLLTGGGMETGPDGDDPPGTCTTSIDPGFVAANNSDALIKFFFADESSIASSSNGIRDELEIAPWVFDGSADFAAGDLYRGIYSPTKANLWAQWFTKQSAPLAVRWYDAWPLFETFQQEGDDPYPSIEVMVQPSPPPPPLLRWRSA